MAGGSSTASFDNTARVWDAATGQPLTPPLRHRSYVYRSAFSPDGRRVVTACGDGTAQVWDAATGRRLLPPLRHQAPVFDAAFSPDGRWIVTASQDDTARVWNAATGRPRTPPLEHSSEVSRAAFSPDGRRIVTASADNTARVWDAATGRPLTPPLTHGASVFDARFSRDGQRIVTACDDGRAWVWDAATGQPLAPPLAHRRYVWRAAFSPDGRRVVTACADDTARVWDLPAGDRTAAALQREAECLSCSQVDAAGRAVPAPPAAVRADWETLRARDPAALAVSGAQVLAWHEREAEDAERTLNWPAALPHLARLMAAHPTWESFRARRAHALAALAAEKWDDALDLSKAGLATAETVQLAGSAAFAYSQLANGRADGYRKGCEGLLDQFGRTDDPRVANMLAWVCVVGPSAASEAARPLRLAEKAAASQPGNPNFLDVLAAALYRTGQFAAAAQRLNEAMAARGEETTEREWLFRAMSEYRLGHPDEARRWLARTAGPAAGAEASSAAAANPARQLGLTLWQMPLPTLRREAEALINPPRH